MTLKGKRITRKTKILSVQMLQGHILDIASQEQIIEIGKHKSIYHSVI